MTPDYYLILGSCIVEAMYNTTCILNSVRSAGGRSISQEDIGDCLLNTDAGFGSVSSSKEKIYSVR